MPAYDYACPRCHHAEELVHSMRECADLHSCPTCGAGMERQMVPIAIKPPPDSGWENENGGRGRAITQFVDKRFKPGDPRAIRYFRSQNTLIETAKREGYAVERQR